ncbi:MAG: nitrogen regulation protein NR(I) [Magnetococcales bacterium]|nr:nitrogen regulation protein NR(I) [Magnetococcales bacterium]
MSEARAKTVLVADDDQAIRFVLEQALSRSGFGVRTFANGSDLLASLAQEGGDLIITDIVMPESSGLDLLKTVKTSHPSLPVIVITAQSTLQNAVHAFERGAFEYLAKPFDILKVVELVEKALSQAPKPLPRVGQLDVDRFGGIIGSSLAMQELFRTIGRLANSDTTVLIHGESGTGKELVARAVHSNSPRKNGPFTALNMAAIPRNLVESELFGHEKGAFTGAVSRRAGHFDQARNGTLFLDEIGDMPLEAQTRLLRVLQNGTFTRVGGTETRRANVRIIAATHQDLPAAIAGGRFREDLFYRLNVIPLHVPSLRSRREDIPLLAEYFLAQTAQNLSLPAKRFSASAMGALTAYDWPGNVRELENLVHRVMVLVPHDMIEADHLDLIPHSQPNLAGAGERAEAAPPSANGQTPAVSGETTLKEAILGELDRYFTTLNGLNVTGLHATIIHQVEEVLLTRVLGETRGNRVKAAKILGINRNTLRKKMQDLGIDS